MIRTLASFLVLALAACSVPPKVSTLVLASCPPLEVAHQQDTEFGRLMRIKEVERRYHDCREAALRGLT